MCTGLRSFVAPLEADLGSLAWLDGPFMREAGVVHCCAKLYTSAFNRASEFESFGGRGKLVLWSPVWLLILRSRNVAMTWMN